VFPRSAKEVALTPEIRALLQIEDEALTPADLIRAILRAPVELLYLGGIGTYVKAPAETNAEAGDKANDAVRIDATE
ncbi:NAD-glutamate dehydrogenase domain-containing protein, partial [Klebsiella pneumoniae]|uniref:NAD-glutamate dehydrogenase domain-containing protein n=1 Tax=Klebsiella pneumoniae TaxID=573 RepID=UPI0013D0158A